MQEMKGNYFKKKQNPGSDKKKPGNNVEQFNR